jgi:uncharacterized membrane protein YoaK (UPF0700 family)
MLMAVTVNGRHTVALVLSWVVLFLLAVVAFTTPGKKTLQRWISQREMRRTSRTAVAVLAVLWALIAFFPLGGYRLLPPRWENCFVQGGGPGAGGTPCGELSGEQRTP